MIKRILAFFGVILLLILYHFKELVYYGLVQGKGQLSIIWNARPVQSFLDDPSTPDSVVNKLLFIAEVRRFAIEELGLNDTENYTSMYDQKGKPILWVVTGCKPYAFEPKEWTFPIVGEMPYKGFFIEKMAQKEMAQVKADGYDVGVRTVGGWSTLGWFKDPILSNMLGRSYGDLANLIIHELVHSTIFVKDSVDFNENLASFIGDRGAHRFLEIYYPKTHLLAYEQELKNEEMFIEHVLRGADHLDALYKSFNAQNSVEKSAMKAKLIRKVIDTMDTLSLSDKTFLSRLRGREMNNTYFMSFLRYRSKQVSLDGLYTERFSKNLVSFIQYMKEKHPFL